jgi:hypothetical protein
VKYVMQAPMSKYKRKHAQKHRGIHRRSYPMSLKERRFHLTAQTNVSKGKSPRIRLWTHLSNQRWCQEGPPKGRPTPGSTEPGQDIVALRFGGKDSTAFGTSFIKVSLYNWPQNRPWSSIKGGSHLSHKTRHFGEEEEEEEEEEEGRAPPFRATS